MIESRMILSIFFTTHLHDNENLTLGTPLLLIKNSYNYTIPPLSLSRRVTKDSNHKIDPTKKI